MRIAFILNRHKYVTGSQLIELSGKDWKALPHWIDATLGPGTEVIKAHSIPSCAYGPGCKL